MKISTFNERLQEVLDIKSMKVADLVRAAQPYCEKYNVKLNKSDISQYKNGKKNGKSIEPKQHKIFVMALALNVSEAWLMGYDVPMNRKDAGDVKKNAAEDIELLDKFSRLNPRDKEIVLNLIDSMIKEGGAV